MFAMHSNSSNDGFLELSKHYGVTSSRQSISKGPIQLAKNGTLESP